MSNSLTRQLVSALQDGNVKLVSKLVKDGADVNLPDTRFADAPTPLSSTITAWRKSADMMNPETRGRYLECIKILIEAGADTKKIIEDNVVYWKNLIKAGSDDKKYIAIFVEAGKKYIETLAILVEAGADIKSADLDDIYATDPSIRKIIEHALHKRAMERAMERRKPLLAVGPSYYNFHGIKPAGGAGAGATASAMGGYRRKHKTRRHKSRKTKSRKIHRR